jgi:DNA anti-recombination protein RmuC
MAFFMANPCATSVGDRTLSSRLCYPRAVPLAVYKRLAALGGHVTTMGRSVENSVKHFNALVGSMEGSVLPQARKFNEPQVDGTAEPLPELSPIDTDVREVRPDRDLIT